MALRRPGTLKKALAFRAVELALRGGSRPRAGHKEDEVAVREHVKVPLLLLIDIKGGNHGSGADHATEARRESHGGAER